MQEKNKFYLTKKGLEKIKKEYKALKSLKAAKSNGNFPEFLHSEDLNPEYLAFQEDMNFLESKIIELENIIKNTEIIRPPRKEKQGIVGLGATVWVEINGEGNDEFEIVGTLEANPALSKISNESPVGSALLGHRTGDEVIISSPIKIIYRIKKIKYFSS